MLARRPVSLPETNADDVAPSGRARFACAPSQLRFWIEEQLDPGNPGLNVAVRWRLEGALSTAEIERAWNVLLGRHETFRTSFETVDGEAVAVVEPNVALSIPVVDLTALPEREAFAEAEALTAREARVPFDLSVAPLVRVTHVLVRERTSILLVTAHHTVCDGWSVGILAREMGELCAAAREGRAAALPALETSYGAYAERQRKWLATTSLESETAFLRRALADYKQFELPTDRPRPAVQTSNGEIASLLLDRALTDKLARFSDANGCTLFITALAGLFTLLHRYTGETDIAIGTQVAGRDDAELEGLVGCFINTIALRGDVGGDPTFVELLDRTRDMVMDMFEVRHVPLERLIGIVNPKRDPSRNTLFSVNFIFQRSFIKNQDYGSFALVDMPSRSAGSIYDLNFFMVERPDGWRASCEYNADLFEHATVVDLLEGLQTILGSVIDAAERKVSEIPLLTAAARQELIVASNRTQAAYPADSTLPALFAEQAARTPDAVALVCGDESLSYAELAAAVRTLAGGFRARGLTTGDRIGILLDRSPLLVATLLAALECGCAYVPLDPAYPAERIHYIARNAQLSVLVTRAPLAERVAGVDSPVILLDWPGVRGGGPEIASDRAAAAPDDVAYVIYTSGSTGKPKGVQIQHRALVNFLWSMRERPGLRPDDTLVAVTTISFDIAGLELYLPLIAGATLVLAKDVEATDGTALLQLLHRTRATVMQATPVTWQLLIDAGWTGTPRLKMLCGGEAVSRALASRLLERGDDLWNMYGPTETTIWSSVLKVEPGDGPVLLGGPIANTQFYVLDGNQEPVPKNAPGELYIGGDGVALGYLDLPLATRERFVNDPFRNVPGAKLYRTGDIVRRRGADRFEFLGRTDQQIKLRGFRIELGEVEAVLLRQPNVAEAVALVDVDPNGEKALWAVVVPRHRMPDDSESWIADLRSSLAKSLPHYMIPTPIGVIPSLPRTPNGKIDRKMLPSRRSFASAHGGREAPRTALESELSSLVANLLERERVGRNDDIFALGFHSLLAVRLVAKVGEKFGIVVPLRTLFDFPTIASLARRIESSAQTLEAVTTRQSIVLLNPDGRRRPFFYLHSDLFADGLYCRRLAASIGRDQPIYAVAPHGTANLPLLPTIEAMARDYLPRILQEQPAGPYRIGGFCVSGLVAYEVARLLEARGETVEKVVMINATALPHRNVWPFDWLIRKVGLDARLEPHVRESICYNLAQLHGALATGPRETLEFLRTRVERLRSRRGSSSKRARLDDPQPFDKRRGERATENACAHLVAALTYHPEPYSGEITLVWSVDQNQGASDPIAGWQALVPSVQLAPIGGGHVAALHENIKGLSEEVGSILCS